MNAGVSQVGDRVRLAPHILTNTANTYSPHKNTCSIHCKVTSGWQPAGPAPLTHSLPHSVNRDQALFGGRRDSPLAAATESSQNVAAVAEAAVG